MPWPDILKRKAPRGSLIEDWGTVPVDASMLGVPIHRVDGTPVTDLRSHDRWIRINQGADEADAVRPILVRDLLREEHRRAYGSPWFAGRIFADLLLEQGIARDANVLDIGCGAGRTGRWLIEALDPGRYFGIDPHLRSLVAFSAYELQLADLIDKRPRLLLDSDFRFDAFGVRFDVTLDLMVSWHLPPERIAQAYAQLRPLLAADARVFVQSVQHERDLSPIADQGYRLEDEHLVEWPRWISPPPRRPQHVCQLFRPA